MKKKLVRLFYNLGWHKLAYKISPSLYYQYMGERYAENCRRAIESMAAFMTAVATVLPQEEVES